VNAHGLRQKKSLQDLCSRKQLAWVSPHCISTCSPTILSFTRDGGRGEGRPLPPPDRPPKARDPPCSGRSMGYLSPRKIRQDLSFALAGHLAPEDRPEGGRPGRRLSLEGAARTSSPSAMLSGMAPFRRREHLRLVGEWRGRPGGAGGGRLL